MNKKLIKKVKDLEIELLDPKVRKDKRRLNDLISDDFIEFTSNGTTITKAEVLKDLPRQKYFEWKAFNLKVKELSSEIFLVTYKVKKIDVKNKTIVSSLRSSIWKNYNEKLKIIFHQGTLVK